MTPKMLKTCTRKLRVTQTTRSYRMSKVVERINLLGHSFDAIGTIKEAADKVDKFLIFRAEDGRLSGSENTFVFRSSRARKWK